MAIFPNGARRRFLAGLLTTGGVALIGGGLKSARAQNSLAPTPACDDGDDPTPAQTEGPFFSPNSPERTRLAETGMEGTRMTLAGFVFTRSCLPVPGALVEIWHADDSGEYDNEGYRLRGHQFTGSDGSYRFETIVPGLYPGRTRHFHAMFQARSRPVLTTQFYFPGEPDNRHDGLFRPELVVRFDQARNVAQFDTVLDIA